MNNLSDFFSIEHRIKLENSPTINFANKKIGFPPERNFQNKTTHEKISTVSRYFFWFLLKTGISVPCFLVDLGISAFYEKRKYIISQIPSGIPDRALEGFFKTIYNIILLISPIFFKKVICISIENGTKLIVKESLINFAKDKANYTLNNTDSYFIYSAKLSIVEFFCRFRRLFYHSLPILTPILGVALFSRNRKLFALNHQEYNLSRHSQNTNPDSVYVGNKNKIIFSSKILPIEQQNAFIEKLANYSSRNCVITPESIQDANRTLEIGTKLAARINKLNEAIQREKRYPITFSDRAYSLLNYFGYSEETEIIHRSLNEANTRLREKLRQHLTPHFIDPYREN